jgi:hypothetical protein
MNKKHYLTCLLAAACAACSSSDARRSQTLATHDTSGSGDASSATPTQVPTSDASTRAARRADQGGSASDAFDAAPTATSWDAGGIRVSDAGASAASGSGGAASGAGSGASGAGGTAGVIVGGPAAVPVTCTSDADCTSSTDYNTLFRPICDRSSSTCSPCPTQAQEDALGASVIACLTLKPLQACSQDCLIRSCHRPCN